MAPPPAISSPTGADDSRVVESASVAPHRPTAPQRAKTYRVGKLTYDLPDSLRVGQTYKAFLTISSTLTQADIRRMVDQQMKQLRITHQNRIRNDGDVRLPVECVVQASLTCVSGNAADIRVTPLSISSSRMLDTTDFTTQNWMWTVTALQPGTYELALRVAVSRVGQPTLDEIALDQTVIVQATLLPPGKLIVHQAETVLTNVNYVWDKWGSQGLTGVALTALVTFLSQKLLAFWKRRKGNSPAEPQPTDQEKIS